MNLRPVVLAALIAQLCIPSTRAELPRKLGLVYWKNGGLLVPLERTSLKIEDKQESGAKTLAKGAGRAILGNFLAATGIPGADIGGSLLASSSVDAAGQAKIRREAYVTPAQSAVRIPSSRPTFVVRSPTFNVQDTSAGALEVAGDRRRIVMHGTVETGLKTNAKEYRFEAEVDATDSNVILLSPVEALPSGEYALGSGTDVYCFAIDPTARAAATSPATEIQNASSPTVPAPADAAGPLKVLAGFIAAQEHGDAKAASLFLAKRCRTRYLAEARKMGKKKLITAGADLREASLNAKSVSEHEAILASSSGDDELTLVKENGNWRIDLDAGEEE